MSYTVSQLSCDSDRSTSPMTKLLHRRTKPWLQVTNGRTKKDELRHLGRRRAVEAVGARREWQMKTWDEEMIHSANVRHCIWTPHCEPGSPFPHHSFRAGTGNLSLSNAITVRPPFGRLSSLFPWEDITSRMHVIVLHLSPSSIPFRVLSASGGSCVRYGGERNSIKRGIKTEPVTHRDERSPFPARKSRMEAQRLPIKRLRLRGRPTDISLIHRALHTNRNLSQLCPHFLSAYQMPRTKWHSFSSASIRIEKKKEPVRHTYATVSADESRRPGTCH